ncbi:tetratricopeptide repeat protein [Streptomyces sp. LS1784]|uniref:tetratricopeptide repeat protein n=1 Tax=Streptomyces sp. LS1784 TaxID=2851533 RepID=UPI001CCFDEA3|nr:tetratricopeptide repeat protein [Streptomyces sp. LS1784]
MHNSIRGGNFHGPVVQADTAHVTVIARPPTTAGLPPLTSAFTGRDRDLAELRSLLTSDGPSTVAVTGLGGIGKTTLAVAVGHALLGAAHFSAALFVDLRGYDETPLEAGQALDTLLRALGVPAEHIPPDPSNRATLYRARLDQYDEGILVVADNVSGAEQVRLLQPPSARHRLLVTSRETLPSLGARLHRLGVLGPEAAVALLDTAVRAARADDDRITADPASAQRMAELCSHLPLALRLAAAQLVLDPHLRPDELAADLADRAARLDLLDDGEDGIRIVLDRSHRRLTEPQAELFRLLALNPGADISTEAAAALAGSKVREVRSRLARLAGCALVEQAADGGRWYLHDLVRDYALEQADRHPAAGEDALRRLLVYYAVTAEAADADLKALPGSPGPGRFRDQTEALAWLEHERATLVAAVRVAAEASLPVVAVSLSASLVAHLVRRSRNDDALAVTEVALASALALGIRYEEAVAWHNLAYAHSHARRFKEAMAALGTAGVIFRELGDRPGEVATYANLAEILASLHQPQQAIEAVRHALALVHDLGDRRREAQLSTHLGALLFEAGRAEEAHETFRQTITVFRELGDRRGEGTSWDLAAQILSNQRRYEEAIEAHRQAQAAWQGTGDRHSEAVVLGDLGVTLMRAGRAGEAVEAHERAGRLLRETGDRRSESLSLRNLGIALRRTGRTDEALAAHRRSLAICQELGDRTGEGSTWTALRAVFTDLGRHADAEEARQQAERAFAEADDALSESIAIITSQQVGDAGDEQG